MERQISRSTLITGEGTRPHRVVLYRREHSFAPYVVHFELEEDHSRFQGSYFSNIGEAAQEFVRRCRDREVQDEFLAREAETGAA